MANALSARISSIPSAAPRALVGERGVDEAVEQDPLAGVEQRHELLGDELRARRRVEQRLGARVDAQLRVLDQLPDALGQLDPAGLAQHQQLAPARGQLAGHAGDQRGLPGAVEALDGDESSAPHA